MATTILRGFKVSSASLDLFLEANGSPKTYGSAIPASCHSDDFPSKLLFKKMTDVSQDPNSKGDYISYVWTVVTFHRELDVDKALPAEIPKGFEELRQEILSFEKDVVSEEDKITDPGKIGLYLVVNDNPTYSGMYPIEEF
ncbi:hypothetical protein QBC38DRAFT_448495 [Podospora fimiseda]|uniref:Uncharacterized protein n=1 Tax=Podospora fimiseda TaxID=252190 RepID=A0AAN6YN54_9PEZI|nr:hypothetical protein QBC38DRAFT_448495 [Podospora fimiseda]